MSDELVLEMRGIRKEFPGVVANDDVSIELRRGEVHALLGENGAGKSTLMNILYGLYRPDAGEILLNGKPVPTDDSERARLVRTVLGKADPDRLTYRRAEFDEPDVDMTYVGTLID